MQAMKLPEKIKQCRIAKRLSANALGRLSGTTVQTVLDIEGGTTQNPSVWKVRAMADVFLVSMDWLTDDSADYPPPDDKERLVDFVKEAFDASGMGTLDESEKRLLNAYRELPAALQSQAAAIVQGMSVGSAGAAEGDPDLREKIARAVDKVLKLGDQADDRDAEAG